MSSASNEAASTVVGDEDGGRAAGRSADAEALPADFGETMDRERGETVMPVAPDSALPSGRGGLVPVGLAAGLTAAAADSEGHVQTASLYLSLMLMVLAFFIALVSMSSLDAEKSAEVVGSVAATFIAEPAPRPDASVHPGNDDIASRGGDLGLVLRSLLAEDLALVEVATIASGRRYELRIVADVLFPPGDAEVRDARSSLLDKIVAAVTLGPPDRIVDVGVEVGTGSGRGALPAAASDLVLARAAALGDALVRRGLPRERLALALHPEWGDSVRLAFVLQDAAGDGRDVPSGAALGPAGERDGAGPGAAT